MFETIQDFIDSITAFEITIPMWLQIAIIVIVITALCVGGYFMRNFFDISYMRNGMSWFIFIAVLNLATILIIFIYYNQKTTTTIGPQGVKGKKGKMGKKGVSVTCSNCKNNLYIQATRKNNIICTLSTFTSDFKVISDNAKFFQNIIDNGTNIDYSSFVNGIILGQTDSSNSDSLNKFKTLMTPSSIAYQLIQTINDSVTKASNKTYGTFRKPVGKLGNTSLGDTVYGGLEKFELNAFMVNGDIMYPSSHKKLVSFTSYDADTQVSDTYTIWRSIGQTITDNTGFKNSTETFNYFALGDICRIGTIEPELNITATIKETCLSPIPSSDLICVFIYVGALTFADETNNLDYTQSDTYLIQNKVANNIEMFSVWRTPLNTFITNCNNQSVIVNNSFIYNMYNNSYDALNEYGNISPEYKIKASKLLQSIHIPKIIIASIFCKHYDIEMRKEIVYYFNRYKTQVPEFKNINAVTASFGTLMTTITNTKKQYDDYNTNLILQANIELTGSKTIVYNESEERHLPSQLLKIYNSINDKLLTISILIENSNNLLDIVNIIFDSGIEARIAVDSDGIAEGGILLNEIQNIILVICKILMPPTQPAYMIKDECLGTFAIDKGREEIIREFTEQISIFNEFTDEIASDSKKYISVMPNIRQYETLMDSQIGQLCGHIDDYQTKIIDLNLEEFTSSRIKQLKLIYSQMNEYFTSLMGTV